MRNVCSCGEPVSYWNETRHKFTQNHRQKIKKHEQKQLYVRCECNFLCHYKCMKNHLRGRRHQFLYKQQQMLNILGSFKQCVCGILYQEGEEDLHTSTDQHDENMRKIDLNKDHLKGLEQFKVKNELKKRFIREQGQIGIPPSYNENLNKERQMVQTFKKNAQETEILYKQEKQKYHRTQILLDEKIKQYETLDERCTQVFMKYEEKYKQVCAAMCKLKKKSKQEDSNQQEESIMTECLTEFQNYSPDQLQRLSKARKQQFWKMLQEKRNE